MADNLQQAIAAIKAGDKEVGKKLLIEVLKGDRNNENAWLWMTKVVNSNSERQKCLQTVLKINPDNEIAQRGLEILQQRQMDQPEQHRVSKAKPDTNPRKPLLRKSAATSATKQCPYCAETIKAQATVCRFCGRNLGTDQPPQAVGSSQPQAPVIIQSPPQRQWSPGVAAVLSLVIPGAGQIYKGQIGKGLFHLIVIVIGYALFIIPGLILHVLCIIDATRGDPYHDPKAKQIAQPTQSKRETAAKSGSNLPLIIINSIVGVVAILCIFFIGIAAFIPSASPDTSQETTRQEAQPSSVEPQSVTTSEGYTFEVPGIAFTDGRAEEGVGTMQSLGVWNGIPREQVNCRLPHGTEVNLLDVTWVNEEWEHGDGRYYFLIDDSGGCNGWITENFLSETYEEPSGEILP